MATEGPQLPHIEVFNRVLGLPMIGMAVSKSAATYSKVKGSHQFVHRALTTAETSLSNAIKQAVPIAAPIARKLESPIHFVDHKLCLGLDKIEEKVPLVTKEPEQILKDAVLAARSTIDSITHVHELIFAEAESLRNRGWDKANKILGTHYGSVAVKSIDNTAVVVDKLIDKYFPATEEEEAIVITSEEDDKLLHTLQTVGRLSNKATRRVYSNVIRHLRTVNKDNLKSYISTLVQFLQLTQYLQAINEQVQTRTRPPKDDGTNNTTNARKKTN